MNEVRTGYSRRLMAQNTPQNCRSGSYSQAVLKMLLSAVMLALGASVGYGQWLETRITLPDSLGGATGPFCLTADTSERYVYVGDASGQVYVVDAEAGTRVAKIPCISVSAVCTNTRQNKVYAADYGGNRVLVISCVTNRVVAAIPMGAAGLPTALCYNSTDDKVYVTNHDGGDLAVIDCSSDSVIKTIYLGEGLPRLCYNPAGNRIFCAAYDTLLVIDGASDSVVAVRAGTWTRPFVVNAAANKVYVGGGSIGILVLDGTTGGK